MNARTITIPQESPENVFLSFNDLVKRGFEPSRVLDYFPSPDKMHNCKPYWKLKRILETFTIWQLNEARKAFNVPNASVEEVTFMLIKWMGQEHEWVETTTDGVRSVGLSNFDWKLTEIVHAAPGENFINCLDGNTITTKPIN